MKRFICLAVLAITTAPAVAADVGVSVNINQPGLYGRLDIGGFPQPQVLYPQPVYVERGPDRIAPPPIYLHVPPGHAKHWRRHCAEYDACGRPVYFVRDDWYRTVYTPRYREIQQREREGRPGDRRYENGRDERGDRHDHRGDDRGRHDERGDDRGRQGNDHHGEDNGRGNGRGRDGG